MLIHERLNNQGSMSDIEKNIANYFLEQPQALKELSARKLAEKMFIATSTVSRFCKKIGYAGYKDFKEAYSRQPISLVYNN